MAATRSYCQRREWGLPEEAPQYLSIGRRILSGLSRCADNTYMVHTPCPPYERALVQPARLCRADYLRKGERPDMLRICDKGDYSKLHSLFLLLRLIKYQVPPKSPTPTRSKATPSVHASPSTPAKSVASSKRPASFARARHRSGLCRSCLGWPRRTR